MNFDLRYTHHPNDYKNYNTKRLREEFLVENLMQSDKLNMVYSHYDRMILGGAVPVAKKLFLETPNFLAVENFLDKREMGIINVGGTGKIEVDGEVFEINKLDALYIGKGAKNISFESKQTANPARFYFNSAAAHKSYPTKLVPISESPFIELGTTDENSKRKLYQQITYLTMETCQLMMGVTIPEPGSAWNTMPFHVHELRMEAYFYFGIPDNKQVCHIMGQPDETRNLWVSNEKAVISPPWSVHCAAGTSPYAFIWGMAGDDSPVETLEIDSYE